MTTIQLRLAVAIHERGSISTAARELGISQPNASNYIKSLESEIGFEIFNRSKTGTTPTEKGRLFLAHAKRIAAENDEIMNIRNHADMYRLRVGAVNYLSSAEPFLTLCDRHRDDPEADFRFFNVSIEEGVRELSNYNLDVVFAPARKSQLAGLIDACKKHNLAMISLGEVPAVISVRKDHPAIALGQCVNITQGSAAMKDYPYAAYRNLVTDETATSYTDDYFVQSKYIMYVDEVTVRLRLVASTNAFSFGITPSKGVQERYGLVSFPVPGISLEVFCLTRLNERDSREISEYISLLRSSLDLI